MGKKSKDWLIFDEGEDAAGDHPAVGLLDAARSGDWKAVDEAWLEIPSAKPEPVREFRDFFAETRKRRGPEEVASYIETLLGADMGEDFAPHALEISLFATTFIQDDDAERLREPLAKMVRRALGGSGDAVAKASGLSQTEDAPKASRCLLEVVKLTRLRKGAVFHHQFYDAGLVISVDFEAERLAMDFPGTSYSNIPVKFEHVDELLSPLPPSHFDAMRLASPERVKSIAAEDPAKLVKMVAAARGKRIAQAQLKTDLTANVMTEAEFKNWWGKRRAEVVRDPWLDLEGKGARCVFSLRDEPKPFHLEVSQDFAKAKKFSERLEIIRSTVRAARDGAFPERGFDTLLGPFQKAAIESAKLSPAKRVAWALLAQQLEGAAPEGFKVPKPCDIQAELKKAPRPAAAIAALELTDFILAGLDELKAAFPEDWPKHFLGTAAAAPPRVIERVVSELRAAEKLDAVSQLLGSLVSHPDRNADGYVWVMKNLLDGDIEPASVGLDRLHLVEDLLRELERVRRINTAVKEEEKRNRDLVAKITKLLSERQHRRVAEVVAAMKQADARAFYESLPKRKLEDAFLSDLRLSLRKTRNDLEGGKQVVNEAGEVWLCLEASRQAKLAELNRIMNVEIPANSQAIGIAREMGDLRENAEYQTAKDHQKVLFARRDELQEQLSKARSVAPQSINTDMVSFGTRFTVESAGDGAKGGKKTVYTLLGPWESDPDKGLISYLAPLGQSFHKKKVGDTARVELPGGGASEFVVKKIENALA